MDETSRRLKNIDTYEVVTGAPRLRDSTDRSLNPDGRYSNGLSNREQSVQSENVIGNKRC